MAAASQAPCALHIAPATAPSQAAGSLRASGAAVQDEATQVLQETEEITEGLKQQILFAREYLKDVKIQDDQVGLEAVQPSWACL